MQRQLTRKGLIKTLLITTLTLGMGSFNNQPASAQLDRSTFRETAQELNLSRSQMRETAGIMRDFKSDIETILTSEQLEILQTAQEQPPQEPQQLQDALNLTDAQSTQLAAAREEMVLDLQAVLQPYQLEGIMELTAFSQF